MNTPEIDELMVHPRMLSHLDRYIEQRFEAIMIRVLTKRKGDPRGTKRDLPAGMITVKEAATKYNLHRNVIDSWIYQVRVDGGDGMVHEEQMLQYALTRSRRATREKVVAALRGIVAEQAPPVQLRVAI